MTSRTNRPWGAVAGLGSILCSAAAVLFERGPVHATDSPARIVAHYTENRQALRIQALLFTVGLALLLWFVATLARHLARADGDSAMPGLVLAGGTASVVLTLVALTGQIGLATAPADAGHPALAAMLNALFVVADVPLAGLLAAVAVISVRTRALPAWLAWLSAITAACQLVPVLAFVIDRGPLAFGGWMSAYLPYLPYLAWLIAICVVLLRSPAQTGSPGGAGESARAGSSSSRPMVSASQPR